MDKLSPNFPKLLVIDDIAGNDITHRETLCAVLGLNDVSPDVNVTEPLDYAIADAVFTSSQQVTPTQIINDTSIAMESFSLGINDPLGQIPWSMVLLDLRFVSGQIVDGMVEGKDGDDLFGLAILEQLRRINANIPIVILSSLRRDAVIEKCRRLGATDFMERNPPSSSEILPIEVLSEKLFYFGLLEDPKEKLVGNSILFLDILAQARRASRGCGNVLITGESGTGKELLASYICNNSNRNNATYYVFNAAGTTESLQQDQLFGHVKGAFTGANTDKKGLFELCEGGTLFIDEVGDISNNVQNQLLRPIESRTITRQGDAKDIPFDVKIILATNKPLDEMVQNHSFKHDLLNRIDSVCIEIPPLRKRKSDISFLAHTILKTICLDSDACWPRRITEDCLQLLIDHDWKKGNVRELRNVLERAVKNHPHSELLLAVDIELNTNSVSHSHISKKNEIALVNKIEQLEQLQPGCWNEFQKAKIMEFCDLLNCAILSTRRLDMSSDSGFQLNLSGAVSFLRGKKVPTISAADFINKQLNVDKEILQPVLSQYPLVAELFNKANAQRRRK